MSLNILDVRLQAPAANEGKDYVISGFGVVQAAIVLAGIAGNGSDAADCNQSYGFWDTSNTVSASGLAEDNIPIATASAASHQSNSNIVEMLTTPAPPATSRTATPAAATNGIALTWSGTTSDTGTGNAHTNVQPTLVLNYIIKT